jgi:hypothetical protein
MRAGFQKRGIGPDHDKEMNLPWLIVLFVLKCAAASAPLILYRGIPIHCHRLASASTMMA